MKATIPSVIYKIDQKLKKAGFQRYIIGGASRALLQKKIPKDWDFTTDAMPKEILKIFPESFYDNEFGTVGLPVEGLQTPVEITTFRQEFGYSDKRRPDKIKWGKTLDEDLKRRDFTINAIALEIIKAISNKEKTEVELKVIDLFGGTKDLQAKIIRAVGNPAERFKEDALRMMRAVRIAAELGFIIEHNTFEAIKMHASSIRLIAIERVRDEWLRILASDYPYEGIVMLRNANLLVNILPELEKCFGVEQKSPARHHIYDVGTHLLLSLKHCPSRDSIVRFATLIHDIGKPETQKITKEGIITFYNHEVIGAKIAKEIAQRFKLSKKQSKKLWILVRWHQFTVDERQTDRAIRRFIRRVGKENLEDILALRIGDRLGGGAAETSWRLEKFKKRLKEVQKQPFTVHDLKVTGHDVMKILAIKPGPKVGGILNLLFKEVENDPKKNNRKYLLEKIKQLKNTL